MKQIDDKELDSLISEALSREAMAEDVCRDVQWELARSHRRRLWRKWLPLVVFSFGVPFLLLLSISAYYAVWQHVAVLRYLDCFNLVPPLVLVGAAGMLIAWFRQTSDA